MSVGPAVCLFTDSLEPSGLGEHMLALARELHNRYALSFVCPPSSSGRILLERARAMGLDTLPLQVLPSEDVGNTLSTWLRARRVELFHAHAGIAWEGHHGVYTAREAGVAAVVRTEHLPYLLTQPSEQMAHLRVIRAVDRLICVSHAAYDGFVRAGVPSSKIRAVRNGVKTRPPHCEARTVRARLGLPSGAKIVLTVARLEPQKGHRYLLDAVPSVLARQPGACFIWAGDGPLLGEFQEIVRRRGLTGSIRLVGRRTDVPDLMAAADLLVLPSLFEGLPLVVLEAMSLGLPVVATHVAGTAEAVEDGTSGRLVPPADPKALARAVLEALEQPDLIARWATAARRRHEQEFSAARMAHEVANVYNEVLFEPHAPGQVRQESTSGLAGCLRAVPIALGA